MANGGGDGAVTDVDVILATATKLNTASSQPQEVADAWIDQNRCYERYFFENVRHGILLNAYQRRKTEEAASRLFLVSETIWPA